MSKNETEKYKNLGHDGIKILYQMLSDGDDKHENRENFGKLKELANAFDQIL